MNSTIVRSNLAFAWRRLALESAFAPQRAARSAERLFTTPPRFGHTPRELEWLAQGTRFSVPTKAGALAAWRFGESHRSAVVFSHGWGGRGAQLRHFGPALLEAHFQVVVFDHGAHGMSSGREASLVHFVDDLGAVIAAIESQGARLAGLIGHSLGAAAVGAWLNATERTIRAVLIASPTSIVRHARYFARRWGLSDSVTQAMQERLERRLGHRWAEFELPQSVAKVRAAALVIHDADDLDVAPASGLALARAWQDARFVGTQGLGHVGVLRDSAVVQHAVDFFNERGVFALPPAPGEPSAFRVPAPIV